MISNKIIATLVFVFSFAATAYSASILGKWGIDAGSNKGTSYKISLEVSETNSTFGLVCTTSGVSVGVAVSVPTKIEGNVFRVLASASQGADNCKVAVQPQEFNFEATDAQLKLSTADGQQFVLNRIQ